VAEVRGKDMKKIGGEQVEISRKTGGGEQNGKEKTGERRKRITLPRKERRGEERTKGSITYVQKERHQAHEPQS